MELALSLGDNTKQSFPFLAKPSATTINASSSDKDLGFCMGSDVGFGRRSLSERFRASSTDLPLKLDLGPSSPVPLSDQLHFLCVPDYGGVGGRRLDNSRVSATITEEEEETDHRGAARLSPSPPHSVTSSFRLDFGIKIHGKRDEMERSASRASDDDENGPSSRKKLRLSKEQSVFLEESFKEHNTLNHKQKLDLAKQLNLRPRQIEVWFQNRRARTKFKQTEVDCEYLKRCCETLTEENRRLQKELQELRALKTSKPFYMQLPATTLTMCPSCERVAATAPPPSGTATTLNPER